MDHRPLRICYLVSHFHPNQSGAERQAFAQGKELVRRGHSVHVVTRFMPWLSRESVESGIQIHRWIQTSTKGPFFGISFVNGAIQALRKLRSEYDLIHTHQALWEALSTGLGRDLVRGAPILVQPASSGYFGEAQEISRTKGFSLLRRLAIRNSAFAAISAEIEQEWVALGVPVDRIFRMASGVDAEHFRPGPSLADDRLPARPRVMFTGRLHPQKNVDLLLNVWPEVAGRTRAHLVLVGDGSERQKLSDVAQSLGIADFVHFVGAVDDTSDFLRAADYFVLPSVAEGMSNSLLEAMSTGLPCLASNIGGNTDLIEDGVTGRLIPPNDRIAWADSLIHTIENHDESRRIGEAARRRIEQEYALPVVVDRYVELYHRLLAQGARKTRPSPNPIA